MPVYKRKVQRRNEGGHSILKTVTLISSGAQTLTTDNHLKFVMPENGVYVGAVAHLGTVNTGATFIVDVNKDGTTLYTTQTRRPIIAISAATKTSTETATADITGLPKGSVISVDIDQIGSTVAGSDLTVSVSYLSAA